MGTSKDVLHDRIDELEVMLQYVKENHADVYGKAQEHLMGVEQDTTIPEQEFVVVLGNGILKHLKGKYYLEEHEIDKLLWEHEKDFFAFMDKVIQDGR